MNARFLLVLACALGAAFPACQDAPLSGPPELRLGRQECAACGMLVSEDRCSSALLVDDKGRRTHLLYDDLGCMLDAEQAGLATPVIARFVHDYTSRAWIKAEDATYVAASPKALSTPMGSGMVAFATRTDAELAAQPLSAKVLTYDQLVLARRAYMDEHFASPKAR